MDNGKVCVYIPVEEYRELVRAQRDAELLKKGINISGLSYTELDVLRAIFRGDEVRSEEV